MSSSSVTLNTNSSSTSSIDQLVSEYITSISQPVYQLQSQESSINSLISTYNSIKSNLSSFQSQTTSLGAIGSLSPLAAKTTSSSDSSVVTATAQATATSGTHSLLITQWRSTIHSCRVRFHSLVQIFPLHLAAELRLSP